MQNILIRNAEKRDAGPIRKLLAHYAKQKIVLPRTQEEIAKHMHCFCVAEKNKRVVGCCAYRDYGNHLYELRSLAVGARSANKGVGSLLVKFMVAKIAEKGDVKIFALTTSAGFFHRFKFRTVEKDLFPQKIWSDCSKCPKLNDCDEEAVLLEP